MAYSIDIKGYSGMTTKQEFFARKNNLKTTDIFWYHCGYDEFGPRMASILIFLN